MLSEKEAEQLRKQLLSHLKNLPEEQASELEEKIEEMDANELEAFVKQQSKGSECFFCSIASGKTETIKVYEDANILAILDISPISLGHTIIMPKHHYQFLFQMPEKLIIALMKVVNFLSEIIINVTESSGVNIQISQGDAAGQRVPHIAVHVIPRKSKDGISFESERKKIAKEEIEKLAGKIKARVEEAGAKEEQEVIEIKKDELRDEAEKMLRHVRRRTP